MPVCWCCLVLPVCGHYPPPPITHDYDMSRCSTAPEAQDGTTAPHTSPPSSAAHHPQAKLADLTGTVPAPSPAPAAPRPLQVSHHNAIGRQGAHGPRPALGGGRGNRDAVWKYKDSRGTLQGPVDGSVLQQLVARGELRWDSRVWHPWRGEVVVRKAVKGGAGRKPAGAEDVIRRPRRWVGVRLLCCAVLPVSCLCPVQHAACATVSLACGACVVPPVPVICGHTCTSNSSSTLCALTSSTHSPGLADRLL